jgi:hypothetical protein
MPSLTRSWERRARFASIDSLMASVTSSAECDTPSFYGGWRLRCGWLERQSHRIARDLGNVQATMKRPSAAVRELPAQSVEMPSIASRHGDPNQVVSA